MHGYLCGWLDGVKLFLMEYLCCMHACVMDGVTFPLEPCMEKHDG